MPLYQYQCTSEDCEHEFDKLQRRSDADDGLECPECGAETVRTFSSYTIKFNGGGFYQTDYNDKSYQ